MSHYVPEADGGEDIEEAVRTLVSPAHLATAAGIATLLTIGITVPIMVIPSWANSVRLVQFESLLALVLSFGVLWRQFRTEARSRHVERRQ
jgi:uncharacterized membrane protein